MRQKKLDRPNEKRSIRGVNVSDLKTGYSPVALNNGVLAMPQDFSLDPGGKVIAKNLPGKKLDDQLAGLY